MLLATFVLVVFVAAMDVFIIWARWPQIIQAAKIRLAEMRAKGRN